MNTPDVRRFRRHAFSFILRHDLALPDQNSEKRDRLAEFRGMDADNHRSSEHPANMISQTFHSFAATSRIWVNELSRVTNWVEDIKSLHLPISEERGEQAAAAVDSQTAEQRIAPTAIVLLGLGEVIFVAFLVGHTYGTLHPVWKAIVGLSLCGIVGFSLRLLRLVRERDGRAGAGDKR